MQVDLLTFTSGSFQPLKEGGPLGSDLWAFLTALREATGTGRWGANGSTAAGPMDAEGERFLRKPPQKNATYIVDLKKHSLLCFFLRSCHKFSPTKW